MTVPVSLTVPQFADTPRGALEAAATAEELGLAGVFLFDHLIPIGDPHRPVLELAGLLGAMAATSSTIRLGTLVLRAPLRGAELSAAMIATASAVAGNRLVAGLGAGDSLSAEEERRYGLPARGLEARVEEVARTIRLLRDRSPGTGLWVGGRHPRMLEVAAEADGWNGWGISAGDLRAVAASLRARRPGLVVSWGGTLLIGTDSDEVAELVRRRGSDRGVVAGTPDELAAELTKTVDAGADELVVSVIPNRRDRWELFAGEVIPRLG